MRRTWAANDAGKKMFRFDTRIRRAPLKTEVTLGDVVIVFNGDMPHIVFNKKTREGYYAFKKLPLELGHIPETADLKETEYTDVLFHLNRLLWEQAQAYLEPIIDKAFERDNAD